MRPEIHREIDASSALGVTEKRLGLLQRLFNITGLRKALIIVFLIIVWQAYAMNLDNSLLFPTFSETLAAFVHDATTGGLLTMTWTSIKVLLTGYVIGLLCATLLTVFAITTRIGTDFLETLTAMFNPLPAIALLPLALIWFGLGEGSLVFVLIHSVLWAVALNTHSGFLNVSLTHKMVGRNYGLKGFSYIFLILIPAAFASILSGMKIGWAFAWRTLIAAELVFGVSSNSGGLGWYIYQNKNLLQIPSVFAGLFMVIIIGLIVENLIFKTIEKLTVEKWGMQT